MYEYVRTYEVSRRIGECACCGRTDRETECYYDADGAYGYTCSDVEECADFTDAKDTNKE